MTTLPSNSNQDSERIVQLNQRIAELEHQLQQCQRGSQATDGMDQSQSDLLQYRLVFENSPNPMWIFDAETLRFLEVNEAAVQRYGYSRAELLSMTIADIQLKDEPVLKANLAQANAHLPQQHPTEAWHCKRDGTILPVEIHSHPIRRGDQLAYFACAIEITDRKQAESKLKRHEAQLQLIIDSLPAFISYADTEQRYQFVNKTYETYFGLSREEICGRHTRDLLGKSNYASVRPQIERVLAGKAVTYEVLAPKPGQPERYLAVNLVPDFDAEANVRGYFTLILDITDRKLAEEAIQREAKQQQARSHQQLQQRVQERTTQLQLALAAAHMGTWEWDLASNQQSWSPENYALFGFRTDEQGRVLNQAGVEISPVPTFALYQQRVHPDDRLTTTQREQQIQQFLNDGATPATHFWENERRIIWEDGSVHWHYTRSALVCDESGKPTKLIGVSMDITERKQADLALRESEERFSKVFHASLTAIAITSLSEGRLIDVNDGYLQLVGYQREEAIGKTTLELNLWNNPHKREQLLNELVQGASIRNLEIEFQHQSGETRTAIASLELIELSEQPCVLKMFHDISDRKRVEEQLKMALKEKEVLLREVHHRVKNNLQIIISFLRMQSQQTDDQQIKFALIDVQNRVKTMSLIHEQLYQSSNLSCINFSDYLHILINNLLKTYGVSTQLVHPIVQAEEITLPIDVAISCGLIVNELVSNTLKYAFPNQQAGQIHVQLQSHLPNDTNAWSEVSLMVSDNGIGMAEAPDLETIESLGLTIVSSLIKQLKGELHIDCKQGTRFYIKFPLPRTV